MYKYTTAVKLLKDFLKYTTVFTQIYVYIVIMVPVYPSLKV